MASIDGSNTKLTKQSYVSLGLAIAIGVTLLGGGVTFGSMSQRLENVESKMLSVETGRTKLDSVDRRQGILMTKMDTIQKQMDRIIDKLDEAS